MCMIVWIFWVGADVLLNHRRQRWFCQVPVAVDASVYQEIDIAGVSPRLLQAVLGCLDCQMQGAVTSPPPAVG